MSNPDPNIVDILRQLTTALKSINDTQQLMFQQQNREHTPITRGNLHPYDENNESFDTCLQRLDNHLKLRGINDDKPHKDRLCVQILIVLKS